MSLSQKNKPNMLNSSSTMAIWGAFISFYCWFSVVPYNFSVSPLKHISVSLGAPLSNINSIFFACFAIGSVFALTVLDDRFPKPLFLAIQCLWILLSPAIFVAGSVMQLYFLVALQGILSGILFAKIIYLLIFFTPRGSWVRSIAISYAFVQPIIYLYLIVPMNGFILPAYIAGILMQLVCLLFSSRFNGSVQEVRRFIPEATLSLKSILLPMVIIFFVFACLAAVKNTVMPSFSPSRLADYLQIIPNAITLVVLYFWGIRLKRIHFLQISLFLLSLTFLSYQLFHGSAAGKFVADWLMQPAYLIWDVFIFSFVADITYKYGKKYARPRLLFLSITVTIGTAELVTSFFLEKVDLNLYPLFYVASIILISLIPLVQKLLQKELLVNLDPYRHQSREIERPDEAAAEALTPQQSGDEPCIENIHDAEKLPDAYEKMCLLLPKGEKLTSRECDILKLLCEKQDYDVIAALLHISKNTVKIHVKNIFIKFKVRNRRELNELMGAGNGTADLTRRETEILHLLLQGKSSQEIAKLLFISHNTARVHIWNICNKYGVSSQTELRAKLRQEGATTPVSYL